MVAKDGRVPLKDAEGLVLKVDALRHTIATRLARAGMPLQQAAYLTGQKTLALLMQVYTHLPADDVRAAVARSGGNPWH